MQQLLRELHVFTFNSDFFTSFNIWLVSGFSSNSPCTCVFSCAKTDTIMIVSLLDFPTYQGIVTTRNVWERILKPC